VEDIALAQLEYSFIEEVYKYLLIQHEVIENTAMKYAQCIKEMIDRAVSKGWVPANIFVIFKCRYEETDAAWLTPAELRTLMDKNFRQVKLNVIRDIYVFQCFTGLSYAEMKKLAPEHIIKGIDGKRWISMERQKTEGDETLPILPLPTDLLRKYEHYPICVRRRRLLPVPTNEAYNRALKDIGAQTGIGIILKTHSARYYFANEVTYNNGVELKSIGRMLGKKSMKTTEKYVKANRTKISESMEMVERRMFSDEGRLRESVGLIGRNESIVGDTSDNCKEAGAKIIRMPV
jgi:integrase